jgi:hypothetical protein
MLYKEHIDSVCDSLKKFSVNEETDLVLLRNHLQQIICDVIVEIDRKENK